MTGQVRIATTLDVPALSGLEQTSFAEPWTEQEIARELSRADGLVEVVEEASDAVIGYTIWRLVLDEVELLRIGVATQHQRRGVGQFLLAHGLETVRCRGARRAHLEVRTSNQSARRLYERHGFVVIRVRRGYYSDGEDAAIYAREFA